MRLLKGIISLLLIAGIFGIVGLYSQIVDLGVVSTFFQNLLLQSDWLVYFYQGLLFVLLVFTGLIFLLIVFKPVTKKVIHIPKTMGQIDLPVQTLEAIARSSVKEIVKTDTVQVKIKLSKAEMANIDVILSDLEQEAFLSKSKQIREKLILSFKQMANIEVNKTRIVFKKQKNDSTVVDNKKGTRVI
ncbi:MULTISPECIES: alkaline shock response membrane anchor protein AmaP [unclassified Enterococcus]|uniref:alkaline shock response membrane anchor protein AmaP n=1 Tax=unclassified Enterococcus TaxID=2608891 RepID=UPI001CE1FF75|nr:MULTISPECIES: alkaline shock response membrane anchor protein AmaP [unclassified Enterococcus]MCA5012230.1 alkaline shock response membrane anchor protein AmaP [Enterococcus sp. S23]MCA5015481.1 alkaline shock response membrane anchor protein AmaP [Enterococcus sp. S22(2020)]